MSQPIDTGTAGPSSDSGSPVAEAATTVPEFRHPMAWHDEPVPTTPMLGLPQAGSCGIGDDTPILLDLPQGLRRPNYAQLPEDDYERRRVVDLLTVIQRRLAAHRAKADPVVFALGGLDAADRRLLAETLGEGEVHVIVGGRHVYQAQETALTGLWWLRTEAQNGGVISEHLEIAAIPGVVMAAATEGTAARLTPDVLPEGTMNVGPLLTELDARMAEWQPGQENHVVSFTLFPMSPADMAHLKATLGVGPVEGVSRGYSSTRVTSTRIRNIWSVQYLNTMETVILDTLEIGGIPVALLAANEDFEDSAERLAEILDGAF